MTTPASTSTRTKFSNPPITEVVTSLYYLPIGELRSQHIGLFWGSVRERFPFCDQQPVVIVGPNDPMPILELSGEMSPMPRFWLHSDKHPMLIQLQRNAFMLNWRRQAGADA